MREVFAGDLAGAYELNFDEIDLVSGAGGQVLSSAQQGVLTAYGTGAQNVGLGVIAIGAATGQPEVMAIGLGMVVGGASVNMLVAYF